MCGWRWMSDAGKSSVTGPSTARATAQALGDGVGRDVRCRVEEPGIVQPGAGREFRDAARLADAVAALSSATRIDIFGVGASAWVGQDLQQKFHRIGLTAHSWSDAHSAWTSAALLNARSVSVALSHSGSTLDTVEALRIATEAGARTVAITNHADSPLARIADVVLTTAARESPFRSGALGSRMAQMMVIDCLFVGVAQQSYGGPVTFRGTAEIRR